jgi:hypothetical protein
LDVSPIFVLHFCPAITALSGSLVSPMDCAMLNMQFFVSCISFFGLVVYALHSVVHDLNALRIPNFF